MMAKPFANARHVLDMLEHVDRIIGRPIGAAEMREMWRTAVYADDAIRDKRRALDSLDGTLRSLEVTKEVSLTWKDGAPMWRIAPRVDDATRSRRLAQAHRRVKAMRRA